MNKKEWWRGAVFYQIYPRSFKDSNNDGVGDLKGIAEKLDYVAALGVDAVWLSPFFKSPMRDFGYDVADYCDVDPLFGTLADFDALLAKAHRLGLKIIIDLVLSHTSVDHPWFTESRKDKNNPKADWYVWADARPDGTPPNNWLSVFGGGAWTFDMRRGQYYYHQFLTEQPDLNVRNAQVQEALLAAAKFWLERGVDGFRLDAVNHCIHDAELRDNPPREADPTQAAGRFKHPYYMQWHKFDKSQPETLDFLRRMRALTDLYDDRMMVAEVGCDQQVERCVEYTNAPGLLHTSYNFSLLTEKGGAAYLRATVNEFKTKASGKSWPSWSFSNHDVVRVASRWARNGQRSPAQVKMLLALVTCLWGTSFIYQGEELGLTEADIPFEKLKDPYGIFLWPEDKGRDGCRTPMPWTAKGGFSQAEPWLPMPGEHLALSVANQEQDPLSPLTFLRGFLQWRRQNPALIGGDIDFTEAPEPLLAFSRGGDTLCVFNLGDRALRFKPQAPVTPLAGHGLPSALAADGIDLPPFGAFFGTLRRS